MIAKIHNIKLHTRTSKKGLLRYFEQQNCLSCNLYTSVFKTIKTRHEYEKERQQKCRDTKKAATQKPGTYSVAGLELLEPFPPKPLSPELSHEIISGFCNDALTDS
jgi:hypothetical protein